MSRAPGAFGLNITIGYDTITPTVPRFFKLIAENRRAYFDYTILEKWTAGVVLRGTEVKSIRQREVNLRESFARIERGEVWLYGMHIAPYKQGNIHNVDPLRKRKLLLQASEIRKLIGKGAEKGLTLVPLKLFFQGNYAKMEIGLAKAKKQYDKREALKKKAIQRDIEQSIKGG